MDNNASKTPGLAALLRGKTALPLQTYKRSTSVQPECTLINMQRLYFSTILAIPVNLIHILLFAFGVSPASPAEAVWREAIMLSHTVLLVCMLLLFFAAGRLRKGTKATLPMYFVQYLVVLLLMLAGVVITSFDQLVTTSITPFLVVTCICAMVFLIRPLHSFLIYLFAFVLFYIFIGKTGASEAVIMSNRVNGITSIAIGIVLSVLMWRANYVNLTQKQHIQEQQKRLEEQAYIDSLTALPNRRYFDRIIENELKEETQTGREASLIILDIDDFKNINDTCGHIAGDKALQQLAGLLRDSLAPEDTIARLGGEEFIMLLPGKSLSQAYETGLQLRKLVEGHTFLLDMPAHLTASFGVSLLYDPKEKALSGYYSPADKALYTAKRNGKNRVEIYIPQ